MHSGEAKARDIAERYVSFFDDLDCELLPASEYFSWARTVEEALESGNLSTYLDSLDTQASFADLEESREEAKEIRELFVQFNNLGHF